MAVVLDEEKLGLDNIKGIGPVTKQRLNELGVRNILDLFSRSPVSLAPSLKVEQEKADDFWMQAKKLLAEIGVVGEDFIQATKALEERRDVERISTGCKPFNELVGGGVETKALTEVYGEFGSGKSQLCFTLSVMVQLPKDKGGLEGSVVYVDTEGSFRPERIVQIAEARDADPDQALSNITLARTYNVAHQELVLQEAPRVIKEKNAKLIVVDSLPAHFRAEYLGRGTLAERQQRLNGYLYMLKRTAETYNCAVVVTNQVESSPDAHFQDPIRPVGGNVVGHTSTYRIYLRKAGKKKIARMVDSPCMPEYEVTYALGNAGVIEAE